MRADQSLLTETATTQQLPNTLTTTQAPKPKKFPTFKTEKE